MAQQELREKMSEIVKSIKSSCSTDCYHCEMDKKRQEYGISCYSLRIIDAFIANGIGDVSELQKECDSKEEAYNKCYFDYKYWKDNAKEYKQLCNDLEQRLKSKEKQYNELVSSSCEVLQKLKKKLTQHLCYACEACLVDEDNNCECTLGFDYKNCSTLKYIMSKLNED